MCRDGKTSPLFFPTHLLHPSWHILSSPTLCQHHTTLHPLLTPAAWAPAAHNPHDHRQSTLAITHHTQHTAQLQTHPFFPVPCVMPAFDINNNNYSSFAHHRHNGTGLLSLCSSCCALHAQQAPDEQCGVNELALLRQGRKVNVLGGDEYVCGGVFPIVVVSQISPYWYVYVFSCTFSLDLASFVFLFKVKSGRCEGGKHTPCP